jgi:V/A-type H+/Na+-transporting ATPase subunit D
MPSRELAPTRIALLELGEERATAREGYALLDEKRMMLAARMLALLARHAEECGRWRAALAAAEGALVAAFDRHGVRDLELRPRGVPGQTFALREQRLLGVRVPAVAVAATDPGGAVAVAAVDESPEARRAAAMFRTLLGRAPALAALECALWRLADEYRRTERRAGAIEHLLLPELGRDIAEIEGALEAIDQEEAQRVRRARRGRQRAGPSGIA